MKITDRCAAQGDTTLFISDFTPLKSADAQSSIAQVKGLAVNYNLSPRDMNKLALQSHLLGAQMLGLENVVIVQGDSFTEKDLSRGVSNVSDVNPTELMASIAEMNEGRDFKGLKLKTPTDFCIGATIDLGRGIEKEAELTHRKVQAGAQYFITQPVFSSQEITSFLDAYQAVAENELTQPVFFGLQVFQKDGVVFSNVPESIRQDLEKGREGTEIALGILQQLQDFGIKRIYIIPPIIKGGARDYEAAQRVLESATIGL